MGLAHPSELNHIHLVTFSIQTLDTTACKIWGYGHPSMIPGMPSTPYVASRNEHWHRTSQVPETDLHREATFFDVNPYAGCPYPMPLRGRARPDGWHLAQEDCPEANRGPFSYRTPRNPAYAHDWKKVMATETFYIGQESIQLDPESTKIGEYWYFSPRYFCKLTPIREGGVTLYAFAPWMTIAALDEPEKVRTYLDRDGSYPGGLFIDQKIVESDWYRREVCILWGSFRDAEKNPLEYLQSSYLARFFECRTLPQKLAPGQSLLDYCDSWLLRDKSDLPYVIAVRRLLDTIEPPPVAPERLEANAELSCLDVICRRKFRFVRRHRHPDSSESLYWRNVRFASHESERSRCFIGYHQRETYLLTDRSIQSR